MFLPGTSVSAQNIDEQQINSQFNNALENYNSGHYDAALSEFNKIIVDYRYNSKTTAAEFFKTRIYFNQKQFTNFKFNAEQFLNLYPESKYVDELRLLIIKYNIEIANFYNAFKEALQIIDKTSSSEYELKARKIGEGISVKYLNDNQLDKSMSSFSSEKVTSYVMLLKAKLFFRRGKTYEAKSVLQNLIDDYPDSQEAEEAKELSEVSYNTEPTSPVIGVMLPLEINTEGSYNSKPAEEILEGIKFAVDEFNKSRSEKVGLLIRDTKKDVDVIEDIKYEFVSLNSMLAVIGPIFSNEVREALEDFDDYDIPLISPTATDDDLTDQSQNFFQANPSFSMRGKVMAQYIFYVENKRVVSVLNSIDGYSPILAASFITEFENLGGKVLRKESFRNDYTNFKEPIAKIYADSLTLEGIYIPLSDNSVTPYIFSELVTYGIKIPIYGNQDWFTAKGFETAAEISNNLVFTSDYFVDYNSESYTRFNDEFSSITGKDVNRNVLYGYDATKFILTALRNTEAGRKQLVDKMISGIISNGQKNNISFDERRINKYLNIVRYRDGVFELVDKFRLSQ